MNTPTTNQQATPQQTATNANDAGSGALPSYEERAASVFGSDDATTQGEQQGASVTTEPTDAEKLATDRRARLQALQTSERERVAQHAKHRESDDLRRQLADAQRRAKEFEERAARGIDPTKLDADAYISLGEQLEVPPDKLAGWIRERMTNPELVARRAAVTAVDPKLAALEQRLAEQDKTIQSFLSQQSSAREQAEELAAAQEFYSFTETNATTAPLAAAVLTNAGKDEFYKLARSAAERVPEGAGPQAILDQIEEDLHYLVTLTAPKSAAQTQQRQAPPPAPNPAAAKAHTTVSNTLAQTRASVVDDETDWSSLSFEERSARLFR